MALLASQSYPQFVTVPAGQSGAVIPVRCNPVHFVARLHVAALDGGDGWTVSGFTTAEAAAGGGQSLVGPKGDEVGVAPAALFRCLPVETASGGLVERHYSAWVPLGAAVRLGGPLSENLFLRIDLDSPAGAGGRQFVALVGLVNGG